MVNKLLKGDKVNLNLTEINLSSVGIGLGWDASSSVDPFDLDALVFMLNYQGKTPSKSFLVYFNNLRSADKSVLHLGDHQTGEEDGDNETVHIDFQKVSTEITDMLFVVDMHEAQKRNQHFGLVKNAFIRIYDTNTREEFIRYNLNNTFDNETTVELGRFYRKDGNWKFMALGEGVKGGLQHLKKEYI